MKCHRCGKKIIEKKDANIIAFLGISQRAFCNDCYSHNERGFGRHFLYFPKQPINSEIYKFGLWTITFAILGFYIIMSTSMISSNGIEKVFLPIIITGLFILAILSYYWIMGHLAKKKVSKLK